MYPLIQHDSITIANHGFEGCLSGMKIGGGIILCSSAHLILQAVIETGNRLIGNESTMPIHIDECKLDQFKNFSECTTIPLLDPSTDYTLYAIGASVLAGSVYGITKGVLHIIYKKNDSD